MDKKLNGLPPFTHKLLTARALNNWQFGENGKPDEKIDEKIDSH
jgi:hypothetical protein